MNSRQVATGTLLTASLLLGGAGLADARPNTAAMDRGTVPCERIEHRIDGLQHHLDRLAERRARLEDRLTEAQADGDARRVRRLDVQIAQVDRAAEKLGDVLDQANAIYAERCAVQGS